MSEHRAAFKCKRVNKGEKVRELKAAFNYLWSSSAKNLKFNDKINNSTRIKNKQENIVESEWNWIDTRNKSELNQLDWMTTTIN